MKIIFLILFLLPVFTNAQVIPVGGKPQNKDTIYIDSTNIDTSENSFYYTLMYISNNHLHEIYRVKNQDYSVAFEYGFSFSDSKKNYRCYTVYDLPTGVTWNIIFDKKLKSFYRTNVYDTKALGDKLVRSSVDFNRHTALIKSEGNKVKFYKVKLNKIWP